MNIKSLYIIVLFLISFGFSQCENDYTNYGSANCDTAWEEYGLNCQALQSNYGWDCSGCACPGDDNGGGSDGGCWQTNQVVDCFEGKSVTRYFLSEALQMQSNSRADLDGGITGPWTGNYYVEGDKVISNFSQGNSNYMGSHVSIHEEFTVKSKSDNTISITMKSGTNAQMTRRTDSQFRYGVGAVPVYKENSTNTQELLDAFLAVSITSWLQWGIYAICPVRNWASI